MKQFYRKLILTIHIVLSVGLMGAVAVFLFLAVFGLISPASETQRAVYQTMNLLTLRFILPIAFISLLIGIYQSLISPWGLLRHNWVVAKLAINVVTILVLLMQLDSIRQLAISAALNTLSASDVGSQMRVIVHSAGGLVVLLAATMLSVYKPRGMTRYGSSKQKIESVG